MTLSYFETQLILPHRVSWILNLVNLSQKSILKNKLDTVIIFSKYIIQLNVV